MTGQKLFLKQRAWYEGYKYKKRRRTVGPKGTRESKVSRNARAKCRKTREHTSIKGRCVVPSTTKAFQDVFRYGTRMRKLETAVEAVALAKIQNKEVSYKTGSASGLERKILHAV